MRVKRNSLFHNIIHEVDEPYTLEITVKGTLEECKKNTEKGA